MEDSSRIALGAPACGLIAGGLTGSKIGTTVEKKIIDGAKSVQGMRRDEYIAAEVAKQVKNISRQEGLKNADGALNSDAALNLVEKIRTTAAEKFNLAAKVPEKIIKAAKNTKIKWIAGCIAAGTLIGTGAGLLIKHKAAAVKET